MVNPLIGVHAALGELSIIFFLWTLVEIINPTNTRIKRAKITAFIGLILILTSWIIGGYYYTKIYSQDVKPLIKEGPYPWSHNIIMETKEHIFLFLPFLSVLAATLTFKLKPYEKPNYSLIFLLVIIVLIGLSMAGMGYLISTGARAALEAKI